LLIETLGVEEELLRQLCQALSTHRVDYMIFCSFAGRLQGTPLAMDAMGVLANFTGVLVHDGWSPYRRYTALTHALCVAHHLREFDGVAEVDGQGWATDMVEQLAGIWHRVLEVKEAGATSLRATELAIIRSSYDTIIAAGHVANPAPAPSGRRSRTKKTKAANLLGRLDTYADGAVALRHRLLCEL